MCFRGCCALLCRWGVLLCSASVKGLKCGAGPGARCEAHAKLKLRFRNSRSTTELLAGGVTVLGARGQPAGADLLPDGGSRESGGDAKERVLIPLSPPAASSCGKKPHNFSDFVAKARRASSLPARVFPVLSSAIQSSPAPEPKENWYFWYSARCRRPCLSRYEPLRNPLASHCKVRSVAGSGGDCVGHCSAGYELGSAGYIECSRSHQTKWKWNCTMKPQARRF